MISAQEQRSFKQACKALARELVPPGRKAELSSAADFLHLTARFSTLQILVDDGIKALTQEPNRSNALALILVSDFVWQVMRNMGDKAGDDLHWLDTVLPVNHAASDAVIGDEHFARQKEMVVDAKWVFDLHSALRHPKKPSKELLLFLREPVDHAASDRLLRAARAIKQILLYVQVDLDPTIWTGSLPVDELSPGKDT